MEDEMDFMYNGAVEVANNRNLPGGYDCDVYGCI
jgi:hypothetical protein